MRLGVDPRKADQMVRGTVNLPHGTGKTARVLVFATGDRAAAAEAAGADIVGSDELIDEVSKGRLDFDAVVATPDLMGKVGRLGRVLGPRGLMPNPKTGTVTPDVAKAVTDIKGGKIEFRVDKHSNLHFIIGKVSFDETQLVENYAAALDEILRVKPSAAKGRYIKKATVSTTMGPGIPLDANRTRNLLEESRRALTRPRPLDESAPPHRGGGLSPSVGDVPTGRRALAPLRSPRGTGLRGPRDGPEVDVPKATAHRGVEAAAPAWSDRHRARHHLVAWGHATRMMPSTMPITPRRSSSFHAAVSRSLGTSTSGSSSRAPRPVHEERSGASPRPVGRPVDGESPPPPWGDGLSSAVGAQASAVSSRRLRVRVKSSGMPGPIVVDTVAFSM